jgi:poly(3-hydroxyalkanoate) synthetase
MGRRSTPEAWLARAQKHDGSWWADLGQVARGPIWKENDGDD